MARITVDIDIDQMNPDADVNAIVGYLSAVLSENAGIQVIPHVIESDFVNPIKLAESLRLGPVKDPGM